MGRRLAAPVWLSGLVAVVLGLGRSGRGALAPPPLSPAGWATWASGRTPLEGAAAVLRLVALGAAGYLLAVTVVGMAAALLRHRTTVAVVARWSPPFVRWLLAASLAGALAAGPAGASAASPPPTMVLLPDDEPSTTTTSTVVPPPAPAPVPAPSSPVGEATITLAPGDHLWSVAARALAAAWGRTPAEREVVPYWRLVVERNRPDLPNPDDPDLVFPGDVLHLPPVPR